MEPPQTNPSGALEYAMSPSPLAQNRWRIAFRLGIVYLLLLAGMLALQVRPAMQMVEMLRDAPIYKPFVVGIILLNTIPMAMVLSNVLAVAGYAQASHGRSPRRLFLIYALAQASLWVLCLADAAFLSSQSPFNYKTPNGSSSIGVAWYTLLVLPVGLAVLSIPLLALAFPSVRRGCFA